MKKIIILIVLIVGVVVTALNIHVVKLDNSIELLVKTEMTFEDTYVDARGTNKFILLTKPRLIEAGIKELLD